MGKIKSLEEARRKAKAETEKRTSALTEMPAQLAELKELFENTSLPDLAPLQRLMDMEEALQTLPDAIAQQMAPAINLTEQLSDILRAQRQTWDEVSERQRASMAQIEAEIGQTAEELARSARSAHAGATQASRTAMDAAETLARTLARAEALARPRPWRTVATVAITAVVTLTLAWGILSWRGMIDLSGQQRRESAALREIWERGNAETREYISSVLSRQR
jgi:chromosome segregation ATPase